MNPNPNDATSLLIKRIVSAGGGQSFSIQVLSQANSIIGSVANYAQILGALEGPLAAMLGAEAQAQAASAFGAIAAAQNAGTISAGAAAESQQVITAGVAGEAASITIVGAAIVLIFSVILASIASSGSECAQTEEINQLNSELADIEDTAIKTYWDGIWMSIMGSWNSPTGGVGNDLADLASEGTGGFDVKNDVAQYHANGQAFVDIFIPAPIPPGTPGADLFWQRPFIQSQVFSVQEVPYAAPPDPETPGAQIAPGAAMGWYGNLPKAQIVQGSAQSASDPASILPVLLLAIQSYLTLEAMAHLIDNSQPTLSDFLKDHKNYLEIYGNFILSQYDLAVQGIVKTEIPSAADVLSFVYLYAEVFNAGNLFPENAISWGPPSLWGEVPVSFYYPGDPTTSCPIRGYAWNGIYGAGSAYPQYGAYDPAPPLPVPWSSPAGLIDLINTDNIVNQLLQKIGGAGSEPPLAASLTYMQTATFNDWTTPWAIDKAILATMARWKAIYLVNGYDQVWSSLQSLRALCGQSLLATQTLQQDGTIANGNWSARELCSILNINDNPLVGENPTLDVSADIPTLPNGGTYSLWYLVQYLDNIANGNWAGAPSHASSGGVPSRPMGLRDRLAAAAV